MNPSSTTTTTELDPKLVIRRIFDAPRELVYLVWTEPQHLERWCCPTGFTITHSEGEIRVGGRFRTCMRSPDGQEHWLGGKYLELVRPEKIAFSHTWEADSPAHETIVTITLEERAGKTLLTLHQAFFTSAESRDGHRGGWEQTFDSLEKHLAEVQ